MNKVCEIPHSFLQTQSPLCGFFSGTFPSDLGMKREKPAKRPSLEGLGGHRSNGERP